MSLESEQAAAAQNATNENNSYNIQAGRARLWLQGEMGLELNDNANYSKTKPDADVILHPALNVRASWLPTEQNTLSLAAGVGYAEYLHDHALSGPRIASHSGLGYNIYSGDFVFNLHDRFSAVDYQFQDPAVSASVIRLENTTGFNATWDLNQLVLTAGWDFDLFRSLTSFYAYSDNNSEVFNASAAILLSDTSKVGLLAGGGFTTYEQRVLENDAHSSVGPFYKVRLTEHLSAQVFAGVTSYQFDHEGNAAVAEDFTGFYGQAFLNHEVNPQFSQSLALGRSIQRGITADLSDLYFLNYVGRWHFAPSGFVYGRFSYGHGATEGAAEAAGFVPEKYDVFGPGISLGWRFSRKLVGSVAYDYLMKDSTAPVYAFTQNRLLFDVTYAF